MIKIAAQDGKKTETHVQTNTVKYYLTFAFQQPLILTCVALCKLKSAASDHVPPTY